VGGGGGEKEGGNYDLACALTELFLKVHWETLTNGGEGEEAEVGGALLDLVKTLREAQEGKAKILGNLLDGCLARCAAVFY